MESKEVYVIWSINMVTDKVTVYCVVGTKEGAKEALNRVAEHWIDKDEQFFCDSTLFFS